MDKVKVSVVMPVYNAADYIGEALSDLTTQTYDDFEIICVNDGSTDGGENIIEDFVNRDERIKVITQTNKGGGSARNKGLDAADGDYILFLDADDRFEKNLIERVVSEAGRRKCDVLIFAADEFNYKTKTARPSPWLLQSANEPYDGNPFNYTTSTVWNKLYRRSYLNENNIRFMDERVIADTMYFTFFALMLTDNIAFLDEVLIHYRSSNPDGATSRHDSRPTDMVTVLGNIWNRIKCEENLKEKIVIYINFACKMLFERMGWFKSCESLSKLYDVLHSGGFSAIGLTDENEQYIDDSNWKRLRQCIADNSLTEFLFQREKTYKETGLLTKTVYLLPDELYVKLTERDCKVVLFGAGMVGRSYFPQLQNMMKVTVVTWVDSGYDGLGFPLQSPDVLKEILFDYIVIGIEHKRYLSEIKMNLKNIGVPEEKILWAAPGKQP